MPFVSRICESIALFSAHKNVFGDARFPYELQLLVNLCNTEFLSRRGAADDGFFAVDKNITGIIGNCAAENIH